MPLGHGPTMVRARETPGGRELNRILMHMALGAALTLTLLVGAGGGAQAQSHPAYIRLGQAKGVLYRPDSGPAPHVGVIVIHRTGNFLSHPACTELSQRGVAVLCVNARYDNNETLVRFEPIALDIKQAVEYLRQQPGISKVVMFGHSGGGSMIAFYEAVAENGVAYCQDPRRLSKCSGELAGLPKVDGLILADAHPGEAEQVMRGLNPSIVQDPKSGRITIDESLNPFNPRNGYTPSGKSNFTPAFQARYFQAQADEMNGLIDKALVMAAKEQGKTDAEKAQEAAAQTAAQAVQAKPSKPAGSIDEILASPSEKPPAPVKPSADEAPPTAQSDVPF